MARNLRAALRAGAWMLVCLLPLPGAQQQVAYSFDRQPSRFNTYVFQQEVHQVLRASGYELTWLDLSTAPEIDRFHPPLYLRLRGSCDSRNFDIESTGASMGSATVIGGRVLPSVVVDCDEVRAVIAPHVASLPEEFRTFLLSRALARVAIHELRHALLHTVEHSRQNLGKERLSARDLLWGDGRIGMDREFVASRPATLPAAPASGDSDVPPEIGGGDFSGR